MQNLRQKNKMHFTLNPIKMGKIINWNIFLFFFALTFSIGEVGKSQTLNLKDLPIFSFYYSTEKEVVLGTATLIGKNRLLTNFHLMTRGLEALKKGDPYLNFGLMKALNDEFELSVEERNINISFKIKKIIDLSLMNNLALFEIETQSELNNHLSLRETELSSYEDLFVIGYPIDTLNGKPIELKKVGPIHQYPNYKQQSFFVEDVGIYGLKSLLGISGSPVLDKNRKVVGVVTEGVKNLLFFTPINQLAINDFYFLNTKDVLDQVLEFTERQAKQGQSEAQYAMSEHLYRSIQFSEKSLWPFIAEETLNELVQAVEKGGVENQYIVISRYSNHYPGLAVKEELLNWLIQAAKQGHYFAMKSLLISPYITENFLNQIASNPSEQLTNVLGLWILNSRLYSPIGWKFKIHQLHKAADLGSGQAMVALMETYWKGLLSVEQNLDKAIQWALKAVEQNYISILDPLENSIKEGNSKALVILKTIAKQTGKNWLRLKLSEMHFLRGESLRGLQLLKELAKENDPEAQFKLAHMHIKGDGVKKSAAKALELFALSATSGYLKAQFQLAKMYRKGIHVKKDLTVAEHLLRYVMLKQVPLTENVNIFSSLLKNADRLLFWVLLELGDIEIEKKGSNEMAKKYFTLIRFYGPDQVKRKTFPRLIEMYSNSLDFSIKAKEIQETMLKQRKEDPFNDQQNLKNIEYNIQLLTKNIEILEKDIAFLSKELQLINNRLKVNSCSQIISGSQTLH